MHADAKKILLEYEEHSPTLDYVPVSAHDLQKLPRGGHRCPSPTMTSACQSHELVARENQGNGGTRALISKRAVENTLDLISPIGRSLP